MNIVTVVPAERVVKRAFYLAWKACGGPLGMGIFQDRPQATEDEVWTNIMRRGDYPGVHTMPEGEADADYVFGRMMKMHLKWDDHSIEVPEVSEL